MEPEAKRHCPSPVKIRELAEHSGFLPEAVAKCKRNGEHFDIARFVSSSHLACQIFCDEMNKVGPKQIAKEISDLVRALDKAIDTVKPEYVARAVRMLAALTAENQEWIKYVAERRGPNGRQVPSLKGWYSPEDRFSAFVALRSILTTGGEYVCGRKRPNGARSRATYKYHVAVPEPSTPGRPPLTAARNLLMHLRLASVEAGFEPSLTTHRDKPKPFASFVEYLVDEIGEGFVVDELVNAWAQLYWQANPDKDKTRKRRTVMGFSRKRTRLAP